MGTTIRRTKETRRVGLACSPRLLLRWGSPLFRGCRVAFLEFCNVPRRLQKPNQTTTLEELSVLNFYLFFNIIYLYIYIYHFFPILTQKDFPILSAHPKSTPTSLFEAPLAFGHGPLHLLVEALLLLPDVFAGPHRAAPLWQHLGEGHCLEGMAYSAWWRYFFVKNCWTSKLRFPMFLAKPGFCPEFSHIFLA